MHDLESWEDHCDFHDRRDYAGLVAYCKDEVKRSPNDLYAAERLLQAFVLSGDYGDAISFGATLERNHPGVGMFSHHILDALFALGKTEADFDWTEPPSIVRLDHGVSDEELLHYLQRDERFVVNGTSPENAEISVARKRKIEDQ